MTKKNDKDKKQKDKLPFAVFICPKSNVGDPQDYKQVFTDIISDRIKQKKRQPGKESGLSQNVNRERKP